MSLRVTSIEIEDNSKPWEIIGQVPEQSLIEAAMRLVESGGDGAVLERQLSELAKTRFTKVSQRIDRKLNEKSVVINLQTTSDMVTQKKWHIAPTAQFGELILIERTEIESYRAIHHLLGQYMSDRSDKKPLSIAVFGPPGSGKSFGIKEVMKSIGSDFQFLEFNLAQFEDPVELTKAFLQVANTAVSGTVPVVLFDEFDSQQLRWLRFFLAPMQDGEFVFDGKTQRTGKAVFVFAGGTSTSFQQFISHPSHEQLEPIHASIRNMKSQSDELNKTTGELVDVVDNLKKASVVEVNDLMKLLRGASQASDVDQSWKEEVAALYDKLKESYGAFIKKKGPDFVSRLSGHIDVLGVNKTSDDDTSYVLRRSLIIRAALRKQKLLGRTDRALVDDYFLNSLLNVGVFRHGARSIEKILRMCVGKNGLLHIPPLEQLTMHMSVSDAKTLLALEDSPV